MLHDPLHDPVHEAGAGGFCKECGAPFPCPPGLAYIVSVVDADVVPEEIHLTLTRDEFTTMLEALRAQDLPDFADRLEGASHELEEVEHNDGV